MSEPRFAIGDLAARGGVSRRTIRYYVQERLLPSPFGLGRGNHYGPEHLDRLLRIKAMQEAGYGLQQIREALEEGTRPENRPQPAVQQVLWRHLELVPGVHLQVAHDRHMPSAAHVRELADWCRHHFTAERKTSEDDDA